MFDGRYDFRHDASRFCRKVFAADSIFDEAEIVFWLDADTRTTRDVPLDFLEGLIQKFPLCYLGRERYRSETGFVGFNTLHPDFESFRKKYLPTYTSGGFMELKSWEDAEVFDHARKGIKGNNLNTTALQGIDHPWPHTVLGQYMEHYKGQRKFK